MSVRVMAAVWDRSTHSGNALLMLLAIADFADDEGRSYPSVSTLATKCRLQLRGAQRLLAELRASGELQIELNAGPKGCNRYTVTPPKPLHDDAPLHGGAPLHHDAPMHQDAPMHDDARGDAPPCAIPLHGGAPEPSLNHQEPSGRARTRATPTPKAAKATAKAPDLERPEDVDSQTWADWLQLRKAKRAPVTLTVLASTKAEAMKAGMTLAEFLRVWCHRGSQGLQADWLKTHEPQQTRQQPRQHRTPVLGCEDDFAEAR